MSPQAVRDEYLATDPLVGLTKRTTTSREDLLKEFELLARQGYVVDHEEFTEGLYYLAILVEGLGSCSALGISVPSERLRAILSTI